jgi:hypothetical protein
MPKKISGYVIVSLIVIAGLILVHYFVTAGYSGNGIKIIPTIQSPTSTATPETTSKETGATESNKISLSIISPKDGETLSSTNVVVKGKTSPNADVFVNDQSGKSDTNGNFSITIGLDEGQNVIVVSANDSVGNATERDLTVNIASF